MSSRMLGQILMLSAGLLVWASAARAENEGQSDLDQATEIKLTAESLDDLSQVVKHCRSALRAGLDKENSHFASELLASTLTQRAEIICGEIFDRPTPSDRWPELRRIALTDLEESLKVSPEQPDAYYYLGRLHSLPGGDRKRAVQALNDAVRLTEKEPQARAKALLIRANLAEDEEGRQADYNEALKLAPHSAEALRSRGLFYLSQNKYEEAIKDLNAAIAADPKNADSYEARGVAYFFLQKYGEALESLAKAIELVPDAPLPHTHRARIYALQGDNKAALEEVGEALRLEPRSPSVLMLRARIHQQAGDSDRALDDVDEVLRLFPGLAQALQLHALLAAGAGKFDQAISDLEQLKKAAPNNPDLLLQLAQIYTADRKPQKALETFDELLREDGKNWMANRGRADALLSVGKQAEAVTAYETAHELKPDDSGVLNNLAWILATSTDEHLRNGKRAVELATEACRLTEFKQPHILSTLAASYAEAGDFKTAIEWSQKAVDMGRGRIKGQLAKELASYQEEKPWREASPPENIVEESDDETSTDKPATDAASQEDAGPRSDDSPAGRQSDDDDEAESPNLGDARGDRDA